MQRFDRILGILLFLRSRRSVSASELAQHFAVSTRTIYRDIEALSALGVPVYAERGREGGFQLLEGYFLPPLMFSRDEAVSLLLGLTFLRRLRAQPFPAEIALAEQKILAALPDNLRAMLARAEKIVGFEDLPRDIFHPEPEPSTSVLPGAQVESHESGVIRAFLQAILSGQSILLHYRSPYRQESQVFSVEPQGLFWDRDRWYLAGQEIADKRVPRIWRADRVVRIKLQLASAGEQGDFDVSALLGHRWLREAMEHWRACAPVKIRLTTAQAERLRQDWYYQHACFEPLTENTVMMSFGESNPSIALELLRWLGPGAELVEPQGWREMAKAELQAMLMSYNDTLLPHKSTIAHKNRPL